MELKINIAKKHFWILIAVIALAGAGIFAYAQNSQGHYMTEVQGIRYAYHIMAAKDDCTGAVYSCPAGFTSAASWHVGGVCDGWPRGYGSNGVVIQSGWMQLCVFTQNMY